MVVAVHGLPDTTGVDDVDLTGHLVSGAEPGAGGEGDEVVAVVVDEVLGVVGRELLQSIPDAVVDAAGGEVVADLAPFARSAVMISSKAADTRSTTGWASAPVMTKMPGPSARTCASSDSTAAQPSSVLMAARRVAAS